MTKGSSPTPEATAIDDTENSFSLYHATLFKTLKDLLEEEIKPVMEAQFTPLQNMLTQRMKNLIDQRMLVLVNI